MGIFEALIAGTAIGAVLGFIGAGGAMLSLPILIYIFAFTPHQATTAALAIVFSAALSGALVRARRGEVLYRDALVIWAIGLITNLGFSLYVNKLPESLITLGFALILITAATSMLRSPFTQSHTRMPIWVLIVISLLIGAITGIFGIGGGFLAIPVVVLFFGTPQSVATGTSRLYGFKLGYNCALVIVLVNIMNGNSCNRFTRIQYRLVHVSSIHSFSAEFRE